MAVVAILTLGFTTVTQLVEFIGTKM